MCVTRIYIEESQIRVLTVIQLNTLENILFYHILYVKNIITCKGTRLLLEIVQTF